MNILVVQTGESGLYYHRQFTPHYTWLDSGPEFENDLVVIVEINQLNRIQDILMEYKFDIVQFSLGYATPKDMLHMIDYIRYRDESKLILDVDDRYANWRTDVKYHVRDADGMTTTCEYLADWYRQQGRQDIFIIENGIDSKEMQWQPSPRPDGLWFGYIGSTRHEDDLKEMLYRFNDDNDITAAGLQLKQRQCYAVVPEYGELLNLDDVGGLGHYTNYAYHYDRIDVSLAPLVNSPFNKSKSMLKIIEAGFKKRAIIASRIGPYVRDPELEPAMVLVPKRKSWKEAIESMTKEESIQRGDELFRLVQKYEVRKLNQARRTYYEEVIQRNAKKPFNGQNRYHQPALSVEQFQRLSRDRG